MTRSAAVDTPDMTSSSSPDAPPPLILRDSLARWALVILATVAVVASLDIGQLIFAPVCLSIVVGSIFGPAADRLNKFGVPSWVSAILMVLLFVLLILTAGAAFVVPLSDWLDKLPVIWSRLQSQLVSWQGFFSSMSSLQEELRDAMGRSNGMQVSVDDSSAVESVFYFAPAFMAQIILFLASLYFFILTRPTLLKSALKLSAHKGRRRSISMTLQLIEKRLTTYLFSITLINIGLGVAVACALWIAGVPSALLWGVLAGMLNYVTYIGPAIMVGVMTCVGLAVGDTLTTIALPPALYLGLNLIEAQFVTPTVLGRTMTLNPFLVFLTIAFWIWLWGPVGGFVAVPILLVVATVIEILLGRSKAETVTVQRPI